MARPRVLAALLLGCACVVNQVTAIDLSHRHTLSGMHSMTGMETSGVAGEPEIRWGTNTTHIEVELAYPTLGWLALGISPNGGMDQSDVLFGYVDDATREVIVQDRYIVATDMSRVNPKLDSQQDWAMVSGSQNKSHTTIRAVRKLRTCDPEDRPFGTGTLKMIYSYNPNDPPTKEGRPQKHTERGSAAINFLQPPSKSDNQATEPIVQWVNATIGDYILNGDKTEYICRLIKLPNFPQKLHAITTYPVIDPRTEEFVHHIVVFTCMNPLPATADTSGPFECGEKNNGQAKAMSMCSTMVGLWTVGGQPSHYPPEAGLPFTQDLSGTYFLIQMHYNNPLGKKGLSDNSGLAYSLTDKLRKYDVGTLATGIVNVDPIFTIPPNLDEFRMTAQCSDKCTSSLPTPINIFGVNIHMHTRGRVAVGRHFRGNKELEPFVNNRNYDFNYQTTADFTPSRTFLPGDRIVTECTFTTKTDDKIIYGGENTDNEMCFLFFYYYPKSPRQMFCITDYTVSGYMQAVGFPYSKIMALKVEKKDSETVFEALDRLYEKRHRDVKIQQFLSEEIFPQLQAHTDGINWTASSVRKIEDFYRSSHYKTCGSTPDSPPFIEPLTDWSDYQCGGLRPPNTGDDDVPVLPTTSQQQTTNGVTPRDHAAQSFFFALLGLGICQVFL
ncbi:DBH-like monooxygenase protein 1 [Hypsibius exemplaris]|uniref:DBH-like monooxygenase protein 1 n=1 Tax=Hypsibius exemplaris TaxID=2072580 RepID=A0A1W0WHS8_HYPEX|nr:DBH-like monooxygenase protein 1 [Hypsibius exemplaris]